MKKLVSLTIIIICLCNCMSVFAEGKEYTNEHLQIAKSILYQSGLGLWYEDTEPESLYITRAQVSVIIAKVLNISQGEMEEYSKSPIFKDVQSDYWAYKYINAISMRGVIQGDGDGNFRPDDYCTYAEAVKMLITCIGWDVKAKYVNGGYPQGYIKTGKELGLFPMNIDAQEVAIKEHLFVLVYNILKTPILVQDGFTEPTPEYIITEDILKTYHNLSRIVGLAKRKDDTTLNINNAEYEVTDLEQEFKEGWVLCLYKENKETRSRHSIVCLPVSGSTFDKKVEE